MKYRISRLLCKAVLLEHDRAGLRAALVLASRALLLITLLFSPAIAYADLKDISRIFRQTPSLNQFEACLGGGCVQSHVLSISAAEWATVIQVFNNKANSAADERTQIAQAIGVFEEIIGKKIGTSADLAGTFYDDETGQQDCNDEAINTTTYMRLLKSNGLMQLHEIEDIRTRNFFFTGWPHTTAVIRETKTGERYAVDSWFYDNGHAATIVPFATWKANYRPADSPIGKPKSAQSK